MSVTYDANTPWPLPVLAKYLEVRDSKGYHEIYQNGFRQRKSFEVSLSDMGSIPNDWICRVFMLRTDMESTAAMHVIYNNNYFGKVELGKHTGEDIYSYQNNNGARKNEKLVSDVKEGDIFSIALRVNRLRDLVGGANDVWGPWTGQGGKINPKDYAFKIWQSNHILLSLHVSQEDLEVHPNDVLYPPDYLGRSYSDKPAGSSMIVWLSLQNPDNELTFGVALEKGKKEYISYGKRPELMQHADVYLNVRNLEESLTMSTSFDPSPRSIPETSREFYYLRPHNAPTISITFYIFSHE